MKKYNLINGAWRTWEILTDEQNVRDMLRWFQDLETYLQGTLRRGLTLAENVDSAIETLNNIPSNVQGTIRAVASRPIEGVMVLQSTEHGSLVWSLATNGEDLNFVFETTSPTTITKLKLVIFYK